MELELITEILAGGPAVLLSGVVLAALVSFVTGELKGVLRPLFDRVGANGLYGDDEERPWGILAVLLGVGVSALVSTSDHAPEWLSDPAIVLVYGVAIGFAASRGRDLLAGFMAAEQAPGD